nr:hypothetical protein [Tanacetum cinerariifolium]
YLRYKSTSYGSDLNLKGCGSVAAAYMSWEDNRISRAALRGKTRSFGTLEDYWYNELNNLMMNLRTQTKPTTWDGAIQVSEVVKRPPKLPGE